MAWREADLLDGLQAIVVEDVAMNHPGLLEAGMEFSADCGVGGVAGRQFLNDAKLAYISIRKCLVVCFQRVAGNSNRWDFD